ncbi:MAG: hypothetical protein RL685_5606 [Pseudomonadota bacterium]|jgi:hypothetical protein
MTGGCSCGRVRYEAGGDPLFSVVCHCKDCQKASGAVGVPVMGVSRAAFQVSGEPKAYAQTGGSGSQAIRHFCPDCGSLLFGTPAVIPDVVTIYVGSLDHPELFAPDHVIFTRDRPEWANRLGTLREYHAGVP